MNQQMIFHLKHEFEIEFHAKLKRLYIFKVKMPKNSKTLKLIPKYNFTISNEQMPEIDFTLREKLEIILERPNFSQLRVAEDAASDSG